MAITIDQAIRDLRARVKGEFSIKGIDDCADMKLGLEGLSYIERSRVFGNYPVNRLLPGETEKKRGGNHGSKSR